ncbi:hypothetical protein ABIB14_000266 [Arthrobacter sp. UYEF3]
MDVIQAHDIVPADPAPASAATVATLARILVGLPVPVSPADLITETRQLEDLKSALAARQARHAVAFDLLQRREQADAGMPADELGAGVGAQLALARRESPAKGGRLLGLAKALVTEMPHTLAALETGQLNEWRATLLVRETACLSAADRAAVDDELAPDAGTLDGAGDRSIVAAARAAAYRRDPRSVTQRAAHAATERHVSFRPAPDTMCYLTALLPVAAGVAMHAALTRHADSLRSGGDERSRGQLMADALVERTTGKAGGISGIEIQLVMTDRTLFQADSEPARLPGYGTVPAGWARTLLEGADAGGASGGADQPRDGEPAFRTWLRRLYTAPSTGDLVGMDSRARIFPPRLRRFHPDPGPHLPDTLLRRPHPAPGPHRPLAQRRNHHQPQRRRTLRSLQPHQRNTRLERPTPAGPQTHPPTHHPHRPRLPLHRTTIARSRPRPPTSGSTMDRAGRRG